MEINFKGANCIQITTKEGSMIINPNLSKVGLKDIPVDKFDVNLWTDEKPSSKSEKSFIVDSAGEYEIKNFAIRAIPTQAHIEDSESQKKSLIFRISTGEINVAVLGHIYPKLSDLQLEAIGVVDILVIPVGGNGYTLDAAGASQMVKMIDPKIVIPTHFDDPGLVYPIPQNSLDDFVKDLGVSKKTEDKLKLKKDSLSNLSLEVIELKR